MIAKADPNPSKCRASRSSAKPLTRKAPHSWLAACTPAAVCQSTAAEGADAPESLAEQAARATSAAVLWSTHTCDEHQNENMYVWVFLFFFNVDVCFVLFAFGLYVWVWFCEGIDTVWRSLVG